MFWTVGASQIEILALTFKDVSVIDYSVCSLPVLKRIRDFTITDVDHLYSDGHSLLSCTIDIATHVNTSQEKTDVEHNCYSSKQNKKHRLYLQYWSQLGY